MEFLDTSSYIFCPLLIFINFFFRLNVVLSSQLELSAWSLGPKAPSVSLCRGRCQLTLALDKGHSALPCGSRLISCTAMGALKGPRGKGREWNREIIQNGVQAVKPCLTPFLHSWAFGSVSLGLFRMVTRAACDLLTVLQTFPHSGRFDILFILLGSPESLGL